jgi:hypothetical protein
MVTQMQFVFYVGFDLVPEPCRIGRAKYVAEARHALAAFASR